MMNQLLQSRLITNCACIIHTANSCLGKYLSECDYLLPFATLNAKAACQRMETKSCLGRRRMLLTAFVPVPLTTAKHFLRDVNQHEENLPSFGFDGLGNVSEDYATAKVVALAQAGDGAMLFLGIDGYEKPLRMTVGAAEAMAVLTAAQERVSSRPVTHEVWCSSLAAVGWKVDRVTVTSLQNDTFYSRVVLSPVKDSALFSSVVTDKSVDIRPSDGIALALRCHAPLFVAKLVATEVTVRSNPELTLRQPKLQAQWILPPLGIS